MTADDDDDNAIHGHAMTTAIDMATLMAMATTTIATRRHHAHESEPIMTWPLIILAVMSIFAGWGVVCYVIPNPLTFLRWGRRCWSRCSNTASRTGRSTRIKLHAHALVCLRRLAADPVHGARGGAALLRAPPGFRTSCRRGSARPGRPSGSGGSTGSWSTSGTSTSCTGPSSSGRAWPSPGSAASSTPTSSTAWSTARPT